MDNSVTGSPLRLNPESYLLESRADRVTVAPTTIPVRLRCDNDSLSALQQLVTFRT
ncbi:MAG: hypothetical protein AAEJ46_06950 [Planctomycetota bacterium]